MQIAVMEKPKKFEPPALEPVGHCPYCHNRLTKTTVKLPRPFNPVVVLNYWACTNDECCLMFWRLPRRIRH